MVTDNKTQKLIMDLSNAFGAPGFEDDVVKTAALYAQDFVDQMVEDPMRNLMLYRKGNTGDKPVLMLDAHSDETAFMIQAIRPNGMLDFLPLGHWEASTVPASKVWIRNRDGELISGVVASIPTHYAKEANAAGKPLEISSMVLDVGATSGDEVRDVFHIEVGDPAVPAVEVEFNEKSGVFLGKGFDCRIGCAVVLEVLKRLAGEELEVDVIGCLSAQEEVGERGCTAAVNEICPDVGLVIEGAPADDSFMPEYKIQTGVHRGPMMRHMDISQIANPRMARYIINTASANAIPLQRAVRSGGGTNAAAIHNLTGAVPAVVVSVPVRYTHSHHTFTALDDFEKTVELVIAVIRGMNEEVVASF